MPTLSNKRICLTPGCGKITTQAYCDTHSDQLSGYKNKKADPKYDKFYHSPQWIKLRNAYRRANPLCKKCKDEGKVTLMKVVDHIETVKENWIRRLDWMNLQSLCERHHNAKSARERKTRAVVYK